MKKVLVQNKLEKLSEACNPNFEWIFGKIQNDQTIQQQPDNTPDMQVCSFEQIRHTQKWGEKVLPEVRG